MTDSKGANNEQTGNSGQQQADSSELTADSQQQAANGEAEEHAAACRRELVKARVPATRDKMKVDDLRLACEGAILSADGNRDVLIERLGGPAAKSAEKKKPQKKFITKKWVEGKTVCAYCHKKLRVVKVETSTDEGKVVRTRTVQCLGKHRHMYKLSEVTTPDA